MPGNQSLPTASTTSTPLYRSFGGSCLCTRRLTLLAHNADTCIHPRATAVYSFTCSFRGYRQLGW